MTGFLWNDDVEGFFGEGSSSEGRGSATGRPKKTKPLQPGATSDAPLTVSQLNDWVKTLLTQGIPTVWVSGEIGNLVQSGAGHVYFTLKDPTGQISSVLWRSTYQKLGVELREGMAVLVQGRLDVYSPRGSYQLVVQKVEEQGLGALQAAFRRLFQKLQREGLFEEERKKPLPRFPERIGFVTSPSGAAIHDFTQVLRRRWPSAKVIIIPSKVQGEGAAEEIARGIEVAQIIRPSLDVLVVGRGGGSLEDLWAFNEEVVVRAVAASSLPTISAVGHEIDVTLCDLAADVRALTPSEAAERVAPSRDDFLEYLRKTERGLLMSIRNQVERSVDKLDSLRTRMVIVEPERLLEAPSQRLDEAERALNLAIDRKLEDWQASIEKGAQVLEALSPLKTLGRGYSLTSDPDGHLLTDAANAKVGQSITTRLSNGIIESQVTKVRSRLEG